MAVQVAPVTKGGITRSITLPGEIKPFQTATLYAKVTGFVKTMRVDRGSRVRAGAVLATLEAPELASQKAEAQSKALLGKLGALRQLVEHVIPRLQAGHTDDAELEQVDFRLKDAARAADRIRASWPQAAPGGDNSAARFLALLADAADVTVGPDPLGASNWLVASARDANLFS